MEFKIKSELVPKVEGKRFREDGRLHRYVRIYLEAVPPEALKEIESVQYELHPTFRERTRLSANSASQFDIKIWTYGYFNIRAKVFMKNGPPLDVAGFVRW
jgi:transcription initiation factor IIF auxiliary subunit